MRRPAVMTGGEQRGGNDAGFTLAEVLVAVALMMVGLAALIAAVPTAMSYVGESNLKTTAMFLAQDKVERLRNATWTSTTDTLGGSGSNGGAAVAQWPDEAYNAIVVGTMPYNLFRRQTRITDCSVAPGCGITVAASLNTLRQVTVTVFYQPVPTPGMVAGEHSVQMSTFIMQQ